MYILIPASSVEPYARLRALSFAPEADLTLSSIPVNEFRADIITEDGIAVGSEALLYDDLDNLWADYVVMKSERLDKSTVRIVAQSDLGLMDRWTMPAEMYQNKSVAALVYEIGHALPKSGYLYTVDIDVDSAFDNAAVTGFCPEQTARERLQWLCLTVGALVKQCFAASMALIPAPDVNQAVVAAKGTLIPVSDTFMKPSVTARALTRAVAVTGYENFTDTDPGDTSYESAVDDDGVTWWFQPVDWTFENQAATGAPGRRVSIDGVTLISGNATQQVLGWLSAAYFREGQIELDCIDNAAYYPGQKVRVYTEEDVIYTGYIQSCDFAFGVQARARLVISSDLYQVPVGRLTITCRSGDITLGRSEYVLPEDEPYDVANPTISWYEDTGDGPRCVAYTPTTPRSSGTAQAGATETVVQYTSAAPARIEIVTLPTKLSYSDGEAIDYAGMVVKAFDANGNPWTNGGLYSGGVIPLSALTLPARTAELSAVTEEVVYGDGHGIRALEVKYTAYEQHDWRGNPYYVYVAPPLGTKSGLPCMPGGRDGVADLLLTRFDDMVYAARISGDDTFNLYTYDASAAENPYSLSGGTAFRTALGVFDLVEWEEYLTELPESTLLPTGILIQSLGKIDGTQVVPVRWAYSAGDMMEASFDISVHTGQEAET